MCDTGLQEERRQFNAVIEHQAQEIARIEGLLEAQRTETFKAVEREHAAKKTIQTLRVALARLHNDSTASDFNEHWDSYQQAQRVLEETK